MPSMTGRAGCGRRSQPIQSEGARIAQRQITPVMTFNPTISAPRDLRHAEAYSPRSWGLPWSHERRYRNAAQKPKLIFR
jgi:hypothetical protein